MTVKACVTGMSAICPLGDEPDQILQAMLSGRSAISHWQHYDKGPLYSHVGGEMDTAHIGSLLKQALAHLPGDMAKRLRPMLIRLPRPVHYSLWLALRAWHDRRARQQHNMDPDPDRIGVIVAGHNLNNRYIYDEILTYQDSPDFVDGLYSASSLDSIHASAVSELLNARGPSYSVGAACASGIHALRAARQELLSGDLDQVYVLGGITESGLTELDNMVAMQAVAPGDREGDPAGVSRPFDKERTGFVPAHGGACLILEREEKGQASLACLEGIGISSDAQHLPITSQEGQERTMMLALEQAGLTMADIAFVSAHATSTPHGDMTELSAIRQLGADQGVGPVKVNAAKGMIGHTLWSAALIETALVIAQLKAGTIHGNLNLAVPDEPWVLDYCSNGNSEISGGKALKNAFGFGGYNGSLVISVEERA
ncbi:beta-ketoacyl-[acyl-carrier-protein] synthase family protein [Aestuariispira insulae]|uniref:Malonyl-ACP decarboxylase/3-oxoacyl-[acyl-carrier-protein] synthase-1 n=1 Tax=Aestuariispira insulae TaxID=1461337 RepID=A0A3D9HUN6_9PROT|nr:beta-ketoacyl-[acyl-carrier-protein] synthase family protein [Aestuariispira insulae]RED53224.1 malonyl-ACP decarboxylase/3-oxoacyl-[acyl-carrier-protein] synthase-1 [Aestuariispira insulae]